MCVSKGAMLIDGLQRAYFQNSGVDMGERQACLTIPYNDVEMFAERNSPLARPFQLLKEPAIYLLFYNPLLLFY